ncbi:hypothetical protein Ga0609869_002064 [Rhodovulum iodosum]|uniref:Calcineurin-like phosphoesterase domain-containing protein n=1 Tax=Rhodovulum iodosum TaxID=68291 RepID=A0ABV3XTQ0_9RHOB|nr:metallophosphoesterase [Rhodovulum robiginosum]RSK32150.1 metallophosphoesterase [Rhodovulum robiginosum]
MARLGALLVVLVLALPVSAWSAPLRVVVISDLNGSYGSVRYDPRVSAAVKRIIGLRPDLVISTGDMVAGQRRPHLSGKEVRGMWAGFHAAVSDPLARAGIPLAVTPGNHDASAYHGFERERRIYAEQWRGRRPDVEFIDGADYPFFYAFDLGGVRFVSLDVTTVGPLRPAQMQRLETALADAGPARIVFSHLPLWPFAQGRETEVIGDPALERLFGRLGIDMHLSGHHHAFYPGSAGGIALISQACLGSGPRRLIGDNDRSDQAITVLDITQQGDIGVWALSGPAFDKRVEIGDLPAALRSKSRVIDRLDKAPLPDVRWQ